MKVGIAASAAVAAAGAFFASQAGAAQPPQQNVMLKVDPGTQCAYVHTFDKPGGSGVDRQDRQYDYNALHWNTQAWNSTGVSIPQGHYVRVTTTSLPCGQRPESGKPGWNREGSTKITQPGPWNSVWIDTTRFRFLYSSPGVNFDPGVRLPQR
jgi:hypothetical protein